MRGRSRHLVPGRKTSLGSRTKRVLAVVLATHGVALATQAEAGCPVALDDGYKDETVYLVGAEGAVEVPNGGELRVELDPPLVLFYVLRNGTGSPKGGAIAVARTYTSDHVSGTNGRVEVWKNVPEKRRAETLSLQSYVEFHRNPANRNQNMRQFLHLAYHDGGRSDDSAAKRLALLPQSGDDGWRCPTSDDATLTCKMMILRYKGVNADGNCMDFTLLDDREREIAGSLQAIGIRVVELDNENGPTTTYVGRLSFE